MSMRTTWFNQRQSARFIERLRKRFPGYRVDLIWDNAPWHRGQTVSLALEKHRIHEHRLPPYSPELNACEPLIRWHKEVLSYNWCWAGLDELAKAFKSFNFSLAYRPLEVLRRCRPVMSTS